MKRKRKYRILSFKAKGVVIPHSLADIQQTLSDMGHRVYVVDATESDKSIAEVAIMDALVETDPDLVITIDNVGIVPTQYINLKPDLKVISWFFDNPTHYAIKGHGYFNSRYNLFCWDRAYQDAVQQLGFKVLIICRLRPTPKSTTQDLQRRFMMYLLLGHGPKRENAY